MTQHELPVLDSSADPQKITACSPSQVGAAGKHRYKEFISSMSKECSRSIVNRKIGEGTGNRHNPS